MKPRCWVFGALALFLGASEPLLAWGPRGHQTVGGIADQLIAGTNAAKEVRRILGSNLQTASVWADCAKGVQQQKAGAPFKYEDSNGRFPECAPYENPASQAAMEAFIKRNAAACTLNAGDETCRHKSYHYADVALQRDHYDQAFAGTTDHDIVSAINAALLVLQGEPSPAPFDIRGKREALRLLTHYVGDLQQPLHVVAVYLDKQGRKVDPDAGTFDPTTSTRGGNSIDDGSSKLHGLWDSIAGPMATELLAGAGASEARLVAPTAGATQQWAVVWASETVHDGQEAFKGLRFKSKLANGHWPATHPRSYAADRRDLQREQIVKAGARLAQILTTLWP